MSDTWSDECAPAAATTWHTTLVAVEIDGFIVFREVPDRGEGFLESSGVMVYTGTVRNRMRIRERSDGFLIFGA